MLVAIMIPTYNERENISRLLRELLARTNKIKKHRFKIIIVDDNSPDGTGEIVKKYRAKSRKIELLTGNKEGLGRAMVRGYEYVLKEINPDVVITNEADFGFSFKHLGEMLTKIGEGYDVVVASRHIGLGRTEGWTINRRLNHFVANTLFAKWIAGVGAVYDKNGAMRAIRVKGVLKKLNFSKFPTRGFAFFFFQIYALTLVTNKFFEVPAVYRFRKRGESKVSFNPKYVRTYARDIKEYIQLAIDIRYGNFSKSSVIIK